MGCFYCHNIFVSTCSRGSVTETQVVSFWIFWIRDLWYFGRVIILNKDLCKNKKNKEHLDNRSSRRYAHVYMYKLSNFLALYTCACYAIVHIHENIINYLYIYILSIWTITRMFLNCFLLCQIIFHLHFLLNS